MTHLIALMNEYGLVVVFANVLLEQGGLPLPVYPTLMLAGAVSATGDLSTTMLVAVAAAGAVTADSLWYLAGRRFGVSVLGALCRMSLTPDDCVRQTTLKFNHYGAPSLLVAKFVPGFSAIAGAMSGVVRINYFKFLVFDLIGAVLWVGVAVGIGYQFHSAVDGILVWLASFGKWALAIAGAALGAYIFRKWMQRRRFAREMQMDRISVEQLQRLMREGKAAAILDVRLAEAQSASGRIPGARTVDFDRPEEGISGLAPSDEIVVYCSCPNEASAVTVAKKLLQRGFRNVHPLRGGIAAWSAAGFALDSTDIKT